MYMFGIKWYGFMLQNIQKYLEIETILNGHFREVKYAETASENL